MVTLMAAMRTGQMDLPSPGFWETRSFLFKKGTGEFLSGLFYILAVHFTGRPLFMVFHDTLDFIHR
jgi:hypothetical protein